jgi:hypothetical protein
LLLDEQTRTHLDRVRSGVEREFEHLNQQLVDRRFEEISRRLIRDASFGDFVPVLAWRYTREALRATEGLPAEFRPGSADPLC